MYNVEITCRVLDISKPRIVSTRRGETIIREVTVGDETGRTTLTLWGEIGNELKLGGVVKIRGAWTSSYKGKVNLNAGNKTRFEEVTDPDFPSQDKIPLQSPYVFDDTQLRTDEKKKQKIRMKENRLEED